MSLATRASVLLLISVVLFLAVEGLASTILGSLSTIKILRAPLPTQYDPELGWTNTPDVFIPTLYGPGMWARTNDRGFRSARPTAAAVPEGRVRVVCSGDSFTFGYGVSNDATWCHALGEIDPRIDAVNMGVNGYGVDQTYLRYQRDGAGLEHDVLLFTFIADDFARMWTGRYRGVLKPRLVVHDSRLRVEGVPVPQMSTGRRVLRNARTAAGFFRTTQLVQGLIPGLGPPTCAWSESGAEQSSIRPVAEKVFESLRHLTAERGSALALVYLPCMDEYGAPDRSTWRAFAHDASSRLKIPFIDLVPDLNSVTREEAETLFYGGLRDGRVREAAAGHYTIGGHAFFARALYRKLGAIESVASRLRPGGAAQ